MYIFVTSCVHFVVLFFTGVRSITISATVCLYICVCPLANLKNHMPKIREIFCTCYISWQHRNVLSISSLMCSHNGASGVGSTTRRCLVEFARWRHQPAAVTRGRSHNIICLSCRRRPVRCSASRPPCCKRKRALRATVEQSRHDLRWSIYRGKTQKSWRSSEFG